LEASLGFRFRFWLCLAVVGFNALVCLAESTPAVSLDTSETLFTVLTAINSCGYDADQAASVPLRSQIRAEVGAAVKNSTHGGEVSRLLCQFYADHQQYEASRTLSQYVSLALYLTPPPDLLPKIKESDLPPDAERVFGIVPLIRTFSAQVELRKIWEKHRDAYAELTERYHQPLAKMTFDTEIYLKLPSAGYLGRQFTVLLEPMGSPLETNARNYGSDYYVIISPGTASAQKMEQIRHTYLHYLLDPLALKYPETMRRIAPLMATVRNSPMDHSFKTDAGLLATECLIRAIEIRKPLSGKITPADSEHAIESSLEQGFVLTRYFYDALAGFEKDPAGMRTAFPELVQNIDVGKETKRSEQVHFAAQSDPELLHFSRPTQGKLLVTAEERLTSGDAAAAQKLAQQALEENPEDQGRALFILAQAATMNRDMEGARSYFLKTLAVAHEPKVVAWSHIYLGRIFDLQEDRAAALDHYHAALNAGAELPEAKAAAEHGLQQPYEPPGRAQ
jgi:hypothetical protein